MSGGVQVNQSELRIEIVCMVFKKNYFVLSVLISTVFVTLLTVYTVYHIHHKSTPNGTLILHTAMIYSFNMQPLDSLRNYCISRKMLPNMDR